MSAVPASPLLRFLRRLGSSDDGAEDGALLALFVGRRDDDAFARLVARHGAMVYGVCRRVLGDLHDAEDAFQATFLVLARRAAALRRTASVASFLHGVAYRVSLKARTAAARRRRAERACPIPPPSPDTTEDAAWRDLRPLLDEELARLPDKYRLPIVLCYLEGQTNDEAARQLGWTKGTVSGRLARARDLLRGRLGRRGVTLAATVPVLAVPALAAPTATALTLAKEVLQVMFLRRILFASAAVLVLTLSVAGLAARAPHPAPEPLPQGEGAAEGTRPADPTSRTMPHETTARFRAVAFAPDGNTVVAASEEGRVYFWDLPKDKVVLVSGWDGNTFTALAYSPDGKTLAVASGHTGNRKIDDDGHVRLLDASTGRIVWQLRAHSRTARCVAFSPDGGLLAVGGNEGIAVFDVARGVKLLTFNVEKEVSHVAYTPDGKDLVAVRDKDVSLFDAPTGLGKRHFGEHPKEVVGMALFPRGDLLKTVSRDGAVRFWEAATGREADLKWAHAPKEATALAVSPAMRQSAIGFGDGSIVAKKTWVAHAKDVRALAYSFDGRWLASAGADGKVKLWDIAK